MRLDLDRLSGVSGECEPLVGEPGYGLVAVVATGGFDQEKTRVPCQPLEDLLLDLVTLHS